MDLGCGSQGTRIIGTVLFIKPMVRTLVLFMCLHNFLIKKNLFMSKIFKHIQNKQNHIMNFFFPSCFSVQTGSFHMV